MLPSIKIQFRLTSGQLRTLLIVGLILLLWVESSSAFAQDTGFHLMDTIADKFAGKGKSWDSVIRVYATRLFWLLATADFCFLCATFVLDKKEMDDMLASVIRKLMTLGFFWFVLNTSNEWIPKILDSFTQIGQQAGSAGGNYVVPSTPDGVAAAGYQAAMAAFQALSDLGTMEKMGAVFPTVLMALIIFLSFLWVGAQLLICKIETSIAVGAGIILLGFGGSKWTTDMASKYMQYSVATGLKLMLTYLLIGMGQTLFVDTHIVGGDQFFQSLFTTAGTALMFGFLATKIPAIASAMMSGSPALTAGDMTGAVIGAGAAVAGLGAAGMMAGKAGLGAASGGAAAATGVGQALSAGIASGMDHGKSGGALAAHALGEVGSHGMGLASAGLGDMLKGSAGNFKDRVGESAGGRVATSINAARGGSMAGVAAPAGGADAGGSATAPGGGSSSGAGQPASGANPGSPSNASSQSGSAPSSTDGGGSATSGDAASSAAEAANAATGSADVTTPTQGAGASQAASSGTGEAAQAAPAKDAGSPGGGKSAATPTSSAPSQTPGAATAPATSGATGAGAQSGQRASQAASGSSGSASTAQPSALAGNGAPAGTSGTAGSSASQPGGDTSTGGAPSGTGGEQGTGDASNGAVSGGKSAEGGKNGSDDRKPVPLHEKIRDLQGYVPDDAAHSATFHIDLKHTE